MLHIDLFSGIGGFALATEMVWDNVEHIFCDNDQFCQQILRKHWPDAPIYGDIRELIADSEQQRPVQSEYQEQPRHEERLSKRHTRPYILTGGFPCQPFSQAGRRKGTADDRYLWPEMFAVIRNTQPKWVIAENVGGLVTWSEGMVLEQVCTDLEGEGYEVQPFIIPACAVNAPHRRDRVWIVANSKDNQRRTGCISGEDKTVGTSRNDKFTRRNWSKNWPEVAIELCRVDDGIPKRLDRNERLKSLGNAIVPQVAAEIMKALCI